MNNKRLGTEFEQEICTLLQKHGYWVHFITPDARGAQPFDIIAVKNKRAYAIECKTLSMSKRYFSIDRLEDNQKLAFTRWMMCENGEPIIVIKQGNNIVSVEYFELLDSNKVDMQYKQKDDFFIRKFGCNIYGILARLLL